MGRNCSQRGFSHFREARDSSSSAPPWCARRYFFPTPLPVLILSSQPRRTLSSRAASYRENAIHSLQTPPKAAVLVQQEQPRARTGLAALSAAMQALCHALATRKAPRGAGREDDKSTEEPLRSTAMQRKGNSIGMKAIPLHWRCHRERSEESQTQGAQTKERTRIQDGG